MLLRTINKTAKGEKGEVGEMGGVGRGGKLMPCSAPTMQHPGEAAAGMGAPLSAAYLWGGGRGWEGKVGRGLFLFLSASYKGFVLAYKVVAGTLPPQYNTAYLQWWGCGLG